MGICDGYGNKEISQEKDISTKRDTALEEKLTHLAQLCFHALPIDDDIDPEYTFQHMYASLDTLEITPQIVEEFCTDQLPQLQPHDGFEYAGLFVSALIQRAYESESYIKHVHNYTTRFSSLTPIRIELHTLEKDISGVASYLTGKQSQPIHLQVWGECSMLNGSFCEHVEITFLEEVGLSSASYSQHCAYRFLKGAVGVGHNGYKCDFYFSIDNDAIPNCLEAEHCTFWSPCEEDLAVIRGVAGEGCKYYIPSSVGGTQIFTEDL